MFADAILSTKPESGLRRFDMRRDLAPLADLIELVFAAEIEAGRSPVVAEMRRLAAAGPLLWLVDASYAALSSVMGGFVWVEGGRLVGNVTLSVESRRRGQWIISNVAVHPDFRQRGIGHQLMAAALDEARRRGARAVLLEVEAEGQAAQRLYHDLGFERYHTVAELRRPALAESRLLSGMYRPPAEGALALRQRRPGDWQKLYRFYSYVIPATVQAVKPVLPQHYRLSIARRLGRWLDDVTYRCQRNEWILEADGEIRAVLALTGQYTDAPHRLQMDVHPERRGSVEDELLQVGLHKLGSFPQRDIVSTVSASYPQALEAFRRARFETVRTLDQMVFWCQRD